MLKRFIQDEYITLAEVGDCMFSTSVDLKYTFIPAEIVLPGDEKKLEFSVVGDNVSGQVRRQGGVWDLVGFAVVLAQNASVVDGLILAVK